MKNTQIKYAAITSLFLLTTSLMLGQGWERIYFEPVGGTMPYSAASANRVFVQDDGTFLFAVDTNGEAKFMSTDGDGFITNLTDIPNAGGLLLKANDGNYVYAVRTYSTAPADEDVHVSKFDESGNVLWTHAPTGFAFGNEAVTDLIQSTDGSYVFTGARANIGQNLAYPYITKINEAGDMMWKTVGPVLPENNIYQYSLTETSDGGYFIIASSSWFTVNNPIITNAIRLDSNGNILWSSGLDTDIQANMVVSTSDGGVVILGRKADYSQTLLKIDASGDTVWEEILPSNLTYAFTNSLIKTSDNGFAFLGNTQGASEDVHLVKTDPNGVFVWEQTYGGAFGDGGYHLQETLDGGYVIAGFANGVDEDQSAYIIKTDDEGNAAANLIQGYVKYDFNEDCLLQDEEQALENWVVSAVSNGGFGTFYGAVDESGYYEIEVNANTYEVILTVPNDYWMACNNNVSVNVTDVSDVDFEVQSLEQAPLMEVEVQNYGFRLCEAATLQVLCENQGTILAENVSVEIELDENLDVVDASVPYTLITGNTYSFEVEDIDFLEASTFTVNVNVGCDIELMGQSLCVSAHIYPDTTSLPIDPQWSGASIAVSAICESDNEVQLKIENIGDEDMVEALEYTVIEDHVIMLQDQPFGPLPAGEFITIPQPANGSFYRIESQQVAFHPGMSMPSAFVEACGTNQSNEVSLGFINQYPLDDGDYFIDLSCTEVVAAYDPNIKEAFPSGYQESHFIEPNTRIDYLIRFQNEGTASANKVVIVDELSAFLNPASIRVGLSSHPYDFELLGEGRVQFTFHDIQLPDSTTDEEGSHGYAQFSVEQMKDLPAGTVIENTAAIYFDFNPAIFTNTTYHTIGEDFIMVDVGDVFEANVAVKVFPNPFMASAVFEVSGENLGGLSIQLFDVSGKMVFSDQFTGSHYEFYRDQLTTGTYFYQIQQDDQVLNVGKLIVQE